jgi:hypothetical protein
MTHATHRTPRLGRFALTLCLAFAHLIGAGAASPRSRARASVTGGDLIVNTAADAVTYNKHLSLREALQIANGALSGPFTNGERAQLGGCTLSGDDGGNPANVEIGNWTITGVCGSHENDVIHFSEAFTIALSSALPDIIAKGLTIDGRANDDSGLVTLDGAALSGQYGLTVNANDVRLTHLQILNFRDAGSIYVAGPRKGVEIRGNYLGLTAQTRVCPSTPAIQSYGLRINGGAGSNTDADRSVYVLDNVIGCVTGVSSGVYLFGGDNVSVGRNALGIAVPNFVGVTREGLAVGNTRGIFIDSYSGSVRDTLIVANKVAHNTGNGIEISGSGDSSDAAATRATISGNHIYANGVHGVSISGGSARFNRVQNNTIGTDEAGMVARSNAASGVYVGPAAHDNLIGGIRDEGNLIAGNIQYGVSLISVNRTRVSGNLIGINRALTGTLTNAIGIHVAAGTGNIIGGATPDTQLGNIILAGQVGIKLEGLPEYGRAHRITHNEIGRVAVVAGTVITLSGFQTGIELSGAHDTVIGGAGLENHILGARNAGIQLIVNTRQSLIAENEIHHNGGPGILLGQAAGSTLSASGNQISGTHIFSNTGDGIFHLGPSQNHWRNLRLHGNGGLGVDIETSLVASPFADIVNAPAVSITQYSAATGAMTLTGLQAGAYYEVYAVAGDPSGHGEGLRRVAEFTATAGLQSLTLAPADRAGCFSALESIPNISSTGNLRSSEFSRNWCPRAAQTITFAPLADRALGAAAPDISASSSAGLPVTIGSLTPLVCAVAPAGPAYRVSTLAPGLCQLQATQAGDAAFDAAAPVTRGFSVLAIGSGTTTQTVTFAALGDRLTSSAPFTLTASASSGLTITFLSQTPAICTISGALVTVLSIGRCTIRAQQLGDATYAPAFTDRGFNVTAAVGFYKTWMPLIKR